MLVVEEDVGGGGGGERQGVGVGGIGVHGDVAVGNNITDGKDISNGMGAVPDREGDIGEADECGLVDGGERATLAVAEGDV